MILGMSVALFTQLPSVSAWSASSPVPLNQLAPNGSEPPFVIAQLIVLAAFVLLGYRSLPRRRTSGAAPG